MKLRIPACLKPTFQPQRRALIESAREAGFTDCHLVTETLAISLALCHKQAQSGAEEVENDPLHQLVVNFGNGSLDASVIEVSPDRDPPTLRVLASGGDPTISREAVIHRLFDVAERTIRNEYQLACRKNTQLRHRLLAVCDRLMRSGARGGLESVSESIEDLLDVEGARVSIPRPTYDAICRGSTSEATNLAREVLRKSGLSASQIGTILLTGGACLTGIGPELQRRMLQLFSETEGEPPLPEVRKLAGHGQELAAIGASLKAAELSGAQPVEGGWTSLEKTNTSYGIISFDGHYRREVISEGTSYPCEGKAIKLHCGDDADLIYQVRSEFPLLQSVVNEPCN